VTDTSCKIKYRERMRQINDFCGLKYGKIEPTDLDGLIEYHDKKFVFLEGKFDCTPILYGQKLAIERLVRNLKKPTLAIIYQHQIEDPKRDVPVAECFVREVYANYSERKYKWISPKYPVTVLTVVDQFLEYPRELRKNGNINDIDMTADELYMEED